MAGPPAVTNPPVENLGYLPRTSKTCKLTLFVTGLLGATMTIFGGLMLLSLVPGVRGLDGIKRMTENLTNQFKFSRPFLFAYFNATMGAGIIVAVALVVRHLSRDPEEALPVEEPVQPPPQPQPQPA